MSDEVTDEGTGNSSASRGVLAVWVVLFVVVLYPLSIGPAAWLYERLHLDGTAMGAALTMIYYPIVMLREANPNGRINDIVSSWISLWTPSSP